jgi:hypothetical protein
MRRENPSATEKVDLPIDSAEPDADFELDELDDEAPLQLDDEYWEAFTLDDDYDPLPEYGDFWADY